MHRSPVKNVPLLAVAALLTVLAPIGNAFAASGDTNPFALLHGKWRGSGIMTLKPNKKERLVCGALYTGSASQLRMVIDCKSDKRKIKLKARLSSNAGRLSGVWGEETFNALGTAAGTMKGNRLKFTIAGNVFGNMQVTYSRRKQTVSITTKGIPLKDFNITLTRR